MVTDRQRYSFYMHRLVLPAILALTIGVLLRSVTDSGWILVASIVVCGSVIVLILPHRRVLVSVILVACVCGVVRMHLAIPPPVSLPLGEHVVFTGRIATEPDVRETFTQLIIDTPSLAHRVLIRTDVFQTFTYNDIVHVRGVLTMPENFTTDTGRLFNYRGYLAKDAIYSVISRPDIQIVSSHPSILGSLLRIKQYYLRTLKQVFPEPSAALAGGITVGERRSLGDALTEDFRHTGLIHIVVLSGYNIAIIVLFINALLYWLSPRTRAVSAIVCITLFVFLVGPSATVVRAALMGAIGALGVIAHRHYDALHALVLASGVMILANPYVVVFDPSFQLSVIATAGLLLGAPLLMTRLTWVPDTLALRELVAATCATYIAVLPLLAYMVGEVSLVSLLVNILVLPVIPVAMLAVFCAGVIGMVSTSLALVCASVGHALLAYVFSIVDVFAHVPHAVVPIAQLPLSVVGVCYALLLYGTMRLRRQSAV